MPDCDYCDRSFEDEDAYLSHLGAEHEGELGRIDRRRVESHRADDGIDVPPIVYYAVGGIGLFLLSAGVVYYVVGAFAPAEAIHEHGTIEVTIDGERLDLYQHDRYTRPGGDPNPDFHVHGDRPGVWHLHPADGERLTVSEAMGAMGVELTADAIEIEGERYDAAEGATVVVRVDGEPVDPESHELREGESLEIVVESAD